MKFYASLSIALAVVLFAACHATQKTTSSSPTAVSAPTPPSLSGPIPAGVAKSKNGVFQPGPDELAAVQAKYKDTTITQATLTDGYNLYTGVCTGCHNAKNIYNRPEEKWQGIIDDMAARCKLTQIQKDAVLKYVFAIKATQPQEGK